MKTFGNFKTYSQVHQSCVEQGVPFDDSDYVFGGSFVTLGTEGNGFVVYNTEDGSFAGATPEGLDFVSTSDEYEGHAWFDALLAFFYVE